MLHPEGWGRTLKLTKSEGQPDAQLCGKRNADKSARTQKIPAPRRHAQLIQIGDGLRPGRLVVAGNTLSQLRIGSGDERESATKRQAATGAIFAGNEQASQRIKPPDADGGLSQMSLEVSTRYTSPGALQDFHFRKPARHNPRARRPIAQSP
jgi:hypothetical protein